MTRKTASARRRSRARPPAAGAGHRLEKLSHEQWEQLCDGCGMCCSHKLEMEATGEVVNTNIACPLLDLKTCRCQDYAHRQERVPECVRLTPDNVRLMRRSLPATCAYRRLAEGKPLPAWHPLRTGHADSTARAGMSARDRLLRFEDVEDPAAFLARSLL